MIAVILGVAGGGLSMLYLKAREADLLEALKPKSEPVAVIVASRDLVKGDRLDSSTLSIREIPSDFVDNNAVGPGDFANVEGQVIIQNLASGKPLLRSYIDREFPLDFSDTIPQRRRAMTIQVDETSTIAGLIRPGNHIDLFVNIPPGASDQGRKKDNEILPVVENVEVLATGADAARDYEEKVRLLRAGLGVRPELGFGTLTLNVTAREAALIALALDKGDILALLRNREDDSGSGFVTVSTDTIDKNARDLARNAAQKARERPLGELSTNENGEVVDANGNVITGVTLNDDGSVTLPDGRKVDPDEVVVGADGSLQLKDGTKIAGARAIDTVGALTVDENGNIVDSEGNIVTGVALNGDGTVTLPDGRKVDPSEIVANSDGSISLKSGERIDGVQMVTAEKAGILDFEVEYIVGGVSEDSVAIVNKLTVDEKIDTETGN